MAAIPNDFDGASPAAYAIVEAAARALAISSLRRQHGTDWDTMLLPVKQSLVDRLMEMRGAELVSDAAAAVYAAEQRGLFIAGGEETFRGMAAFYQAVTAYLVHARGGFIAVKHIDLPGDATIYRRLVSTDDGDVIELRTADPKTVPS